MSIPLAISLVLLCSKFKNRLAKRLLISIPVFTLAFLMIMNPQASIDNNFLSPDSGVRYAFTKSELQGMNTVSRLWNGTIGGDYICSDPITLEFNHPFTPIDEALYFQEFTDCGDLAILIREEILTHPFNSLGGTLRLNQDPRDAVNEQCFSRIYDCQSVEAYVNTDQ